MPSHYAEEEEAIRIEQEEHRKKVMKNSEEPEAAVTIELPDTIVLKLALQAHEKDITLNKMCGIVLKHGLKNMGFKYEHPPKPQVLKEY